ncbi:MAG: type IX secretion system outer membrane channel protein PorV [Bacteroidota bacterium]|nr:type IX secretion system outer membrane channel protein PorV [Bacteroidota bacterium]
MINIKLIKLLFVCAFCCFNFLVFAQSSSTEQVSGNNPISTAVPFLSVNPDARHNAMGGVGVATSPDATSEYWNPSKYAFVEEKYGIALTYTPWLRKLVNGISLTYLSGFYKIDNNQTFGSSLRYFSMGSIQLTDNDGTNIASVSPNEFAFDVSYSKKLSDCISGGVALRYIHSGLPAGIGTGTYVSGNAFAADISFFYKNKLDDQSSIAAGVNLSNIGSKISYYNGQNKEFLPANFRFGSTYSLDIDNLNSLSFSLDCNKLLVPTPYVATSVSEDNNLIVSKNNNTNKSVISALFSSFTDAPGGLKEELQEICMSTGVEYWYDHKFAGRIGYSYENQNKGNRKYFSLGVGAKTNICSIDLSYLLPLRANNSLANTFCISLLFDINNFRQLN